MATVQGKDDFDAEAAAKALRDAMKGLGTDEDTIVQVVAEHNNEQRQEIKAQYKTLFGEDLEEKIKSELRGSFERAVMGFMALPQEFDARELRAAMKGPGTDDAVLIEILTPRTNEQIEAIKETYEKEFERNLEEDLESETSGNFKRLLVSLCNAGRDESDDVDLEKAKEDAQAIYDAGEGQFGTDESTFNMILCSRSVRQLRATFAAYKIIAENDIEDAIRSECSGSLQDGYLCIVQCVKDPAQFFAYRLNKSMAGIGTDEDGLIRVFVARSEIDLAEVKDGYPAAYEKSLAEAIKGDCGGDLKAIFLAVLGEE